MESADRPGRALVPQDWLQGRPSSIPTQIHASDSPDAAVVRPQRPGDGGCADRGADDASVCSHRLDGREDPG